MAYLQNLSAYISKQKTFVKIGLIFIVFLFVVQGVGLVSYHKNAQRLREFDPWKPNASNQTVPVLARWDSGWYVGIVKWGYYLSPGKNSDVVFFPLYPLLIKGASTILPINYFYLGEAISWLSLFGALLFFYKLLILDYTEKQTYRALLYLLLFPWAFFLASVYTESLFLMLILASFYYARKQNWALAALFGFFAGLTRITGIFLLPALLWKYYAQNKKLDVKALWLALIPLGLLSFMVYLKSRVGDALAFVHNQITFGRKNTFPLRTLSWDVRNIIHFFKDGDVLKAAVYALGLLALTACVILLIKTYKNIRASYLIFAFFAILLPLFTGTTTSIGRYLTTIFPIFIAASSIENKWFKLGWITICGIFLIVFTYSFVAWYFIV
jgi:Gpi18-like mannosyltransferase